MKITREFARLHPNVCVPMSVCVFWCNHKLRNYRYRSSNKISLSNVVMKITRRVACRLACVPHSNDDLWKSTVAVATMQFNDRFICFVDMKVILISYGSENHQTRWYINVFQARTLKIHCGCCHNAIQWSFYLFVGMKVILISYGSENHQAGWCIPVFQARTLKIHCGSYHNEIQWSFYLFCRYESYLYKLR